MNMRLDKLLGIKYPIIQGGMANIATGEFAAQVANAGGLGLIAAGSLDREGLIKHIADAKAITDKPFGVNLMLMNPHSDDLVDVVIEQGVKIVTTGAGNPGKYVEKFKSNGIKVFPVVPSVALAKRMERLGVDGVIVEGTEAGGHIGDLTTMALVPQVIAAVNLPVIAAGGIASGPQMLAAFALGAIGVQVGTVLLGTVECPIHQNYKDAILKAKDTSTIVTGRIAGTPVRSLKNPMTKEYVKLEKEGKSMMELETYTLGSLRKAVMEGNLTEGSFMAGQVAGMVTELDTIANVFERLMNDCKVQYKNIEEIVNG